MRFCAVLTYDKTYVGTHLSASACGKPQIKCCSCVHLIPFFMMESSPFLVDNVHLSKEYLWALFQLIYPGMRKGADQV